MLTTDNSSFFTREISKSICGNFFREAALLQASTTLVDSLRITELMFLKISDTNLVTTKLRTK
jgi:hypothetical protein